MPLIPYRAVGRAPSTSPAIRATGRAAGRRCRSLDIAVPRSPRRVPGVGKERGSGLHAPGAYRGGRRGRQARLGYAPPIPQGRMSQPRGCIAGERRLPSRATVWRPRRNWPAHERGANHVEDAARVKEEDRHPCRQHPRDSVGDGRHGVKPPPVARPRRPADRARTHTRWRVCRPTLRPSRLPPEATSRASKR